MKNMSENPVCRKRLHFQRDAFGRRLELPFPQIHTTKRKCNANEALPNIFTFDGKNIAIGVPDDR